MRPRAAALRPAPLAARLRARAAAARDWFFPPPLALPAGLGHLLGILYPRLDRRRIRFHRGMPHVLHWISGQAITLPALSPRAGRVYLRPACCGIASVDDVGLYAHEAYHLLQLQDSGWGLGLARPFVVLYLACAAANGFRYAGHPMESEAYRVAGRRAGLFERAVDPDLLPFAHFAGEAGCEGPDLAGLALCCAPAVTESSGVAFWRKLAASTPGFAPLTTPARWLAARRGEGLRAALFAVALALPAAAALAVAGLAVAVWLLVWALAAILLAVAELAVLSLGALVVAALSAAASLAALRRSKS